MMYFAGRTKTVGALRWCRAGDSSADGAPTVDTLTPKRIRWHWMRIRLVDDGSLTLDEFSDFFCDGVLSTAQLEALFKAVDADSSESITTEELSCTHSDSPLRLDSPADLDGCPYAVGCPEWQRYPESYPRFHLPGPAYFKANWGPFQKVFAALETLNVSIGEALTATAKQSTAADDVSAFHRFYLGEAATTMAKMQHPLEQAQNAMRERAVTALGPDHRPHQVVVSQSTASRRSAASRGVPSATKEEVAGEAGLAGQVGRLRQLLDRMERKVKLDTVDQEQVQSIEDDAVVLVSRTVRCVAGDEEPLHRALK